jgi:two-component system, NtrC family, sensor histidine kinase HupT/HoxJ
MTDKATKTTHHDQTGHPGELIGVGEDVWMDVIQKMDEVYADLLQYEVALEEKNAKLEESQQFILSVLTSMSDIMVVCDRHGSDRGREQLAGRVLRPECR